MEAAAAALDRALDDRARQHARQAACKDATTRRRRRTRRALRSGSLPSTGRPRRSIRPSPTMRLARRPPRLSHCLTRCAATSKGVEAGVGWGEDVPRGGTARRRGRRLAEERPPPEWEPPTDAVEVVEGLGDAEGSYEQALLKRLGQLQADEAERLRQKALRDAALATLGELLPPLIARRRKAADAAAREADAARRAVRTPWWRRRRLSSRKRWRRRRRMPPTSRPNSRPSPRFRTARSLRSRPRCSLCRPTRTRRRRCVSCSAPGRPTRPPSQL